MAIPDFQRLMLPLMELVADGSECLFRDAVSRLADQFGLTEDERAQRIPSGLAPVFSNRVGWARTHFKHAELIESPRRGMFRITADGRALLARKPAAIDMKTLDGFAAYRAYRNKSKVPSDSVDDDRTEPASAPMTGPAQSEVTPDEAIDAAYKRYKAEIELEVLDRVKSVTPARFEEIVVELLVAMGYGGTRADAGRAIGRSGDGGIDGVINEDRLGLDVIYVQAKRWEGTVGRPEIQKFAGALHGQQATKGVFITTSAFSREAHEFARGIALKIILIDGERLAALMVEHDVGVARVGAYVLKRLDNDYFDPA